MGSSARGRIAVISTGLSLGGAETQLVQLAIGLKQRGWDVLVVALIKPAAFVTELNAAGVKVTSLAIKKGVPDPRAIVRLGRILQSWHPHIVHSHMVHANLLARISRILFRVPVLICSAHSLHEGGWMLERAYQWTDALCDLTTNVSQAAVDRYVAIGAVRKEKINLMANGVDIKRYKPDAETRKRVRQELRVEGKFVWLAVGRLETVKDYPTLLKALAQLVAVRPNAVIFLVGSGSVEGELHDFALSLGLSSHVQFLGERADIPYLMQGADAFVISSVWEGLPMVLLEAGASGLPSVATDVGGVKEIVVPGGTGLLVEPQQPGRLAAAMQEIVDMPVNARLAWGQAARAKVVREYSLEHILDCWETLYDQQLQAKDVRLP